MRLLVAAVAMVLVAGCGSSASPSDGGGPSPGPVAVARQLIESLERGDCAVAQKTVLDPSALDCAAVKELKGSLADDGIDVGDITYTAGDVVDDSSTVSVDLGDGKAAATLNVERVDGDWKVVYDSPV